MPKRRLRAPSSLSIILPLNSARSSLFVLDRTLYSITHSLQTRSPYVILFCPHQHVASPPPLSSNSRFIPQWPIILRHIRTSCTLITPRHIFPISLNLVRHSHYHGIRKNHSIQTHIQPYFGCLRGESCSGPLRCFSRSNLLSVKTETLRNTVHWLNTFTREMRSTV